MEMLGNRHLGITQQQAWEALNDPETLKKCIPGCDKFELTDDNTYSVALALKIGPVSAKFQGKVMLSDIVAPDGYKLTFEGQGGVARALVKYAQEHHVTQIVVGESSRSRLEEFLRGNIIAILLRETRNVDVYVISRD